MNGESLVQELDSRFGRLTADVPSTGRLCMLEESPFQGYVGGGPTDSAALLLLLLLEALAGHGGRTHPSAQQV